MVNAKFRLVRRQLELHARAQDLRRSGTMETVDVRVVYVNVLRPGLDFRQVFEVGAVERIVAVGRLDA